MKYLGGKVRVAKRIAAHINGESTLRPYWEPFVGGGSIICKVDAPRRLGSDTCLPLINMYRALQRGWVPPDELSENEYRSIKATKDPNDPVTAFAGFACSYAGKWFGGYARDGQGKRNYAREGRDALIRWRDETRDVEFYHRDYSGQVPEGWVIYCDPPYAGTTSYDAVGRFDSEAFWEWVRALAVNNLVFVSEYSAPDWAPMHDSFERNLEMARAGGVRRVERLFKVGS